jgi:hypothetical protein
MKEFVLPSNNQRVIRLIGLVFRTCFRTKADSIKQCVEPESTKDLNRISGTDCYDKLELEKMGILLYFLFLTWTKSL